MTEEQLLTLERELALLGLAYDAEAARWLVGDAAIDDQAALAAAPRVSLEELRSLEAHLQARWHAQAASDPTLDDALSTRHAQPHHNPHVALRDSEIRLEERNL